MGSCGVVGSVRARYLVFFQYLGTDFKYVFPVLPTVSPLGLAGGLQDGQGEARSALGRPVGLGMRNFRSLEHWPDLYERARGPRPQVGQLPQPRRITHSRLSPQWGRSREG